MAGYPLNINKYNLDLLIGVDEKDFISINIVLYVEEFDIAMEVDAGAENKSANNAPNVNRNQEIYDALKNYLGVLTQVKD